MYIFELREFLIKQYYYYINSFFTIKYQSNFMEYKIKRVILEIFDFMSKAIKSGKDYQTLLIRPSADSSFTHFLD